MEVDVCEQHGDHQGEAKVQADETGQERGRVFCTSLGTPLSPSKLVDRFKTLLIKANLPAIRLNDLRHSAATSLLSMGVHLKVVQKLLGHNQISMTMDIYSHVLPTMRRMR